MRARARARCRLRQREVFAVWSSRRKIRQPCTGRVLGCQASRATERRDISTRGPRYRRGIIADRRLCLACFSCGESWPRVASGERDGRMRRGRRQNKKCLLTSSRQRRRQRRRRQWRQLLPRPAPRAVYDRTNRDRYRWRVVTIVDLDCFPRSLAKIRMSAQGTRQSDACQSDASPCRSFNVQRSCNLLRRCDEPIRCWMSRWSPTIRRSAARGRARAVTRYVCVRACEVGFSRDTCPRRRTCVRACVRSATNSRKLTVMCAYRSLSLSLSVPPLHTSPGGAAAACKCHWHNVRSKRRRWHAKNDETSAPHGGSDTTDGRASARARGRSRGRAWALAAAELPDGQRANALAFGPVMIFACANATDNW